MEKIILASNSPRRRELLAQAGIDFEVIPADIDEVVESDSPAEVVMSLSKQKALWVADQNPYRTVIGADTVVAYDGEILGKPKDEQEALDMLSMLSGRTHKVYTGVTIVRDSATEGRDVETFAVETSVTMYENDRQTLLEYIATKEPMDKAGAYGIQGKGALLVKEIKGDYFNVVGLPIAELCRRLMFGTK